jgi:hypothetical protein
MYYSYVPASLQAKIKWKVDEIANGLNRISDYLDRNKEADKPAKGPNRYRYSQEFLVLTGNWEPYGV